MMFNKEKGLTLTEILLAFVVITGLIGVITVAWSRADKDRVALIIARQAITSLQKIKSAYSVANDYTGMTASNIRSNALYDPSLVLKGNSLYHAGGLQILLDNNNTAGYGTGIPVGQGIQATIYLQEISMCEDLVRQLLVVSDYVGVYGATIKTVGNAASEAAIRARCNKGYLQGPIDTNGFYTIAAMVL